MAPSNGHTPKAVVVISLAAQALPSMLEIRCSATTATNDALWLMNTEISELTEDELDQIAGGTPSIPIPPPAPNVTVNGGPLGFVAPLHVARS
jgi:hypothetical protein